MVRNNSIDIAKGLGILLVVLGHNWIITHQGGLPLQFIFSFHMPLFFLLGGVFLSTSARFPEFIRSKADALLKPYAVVLILLGAYRIGLGLSLPGPYFAGVLYGVGSTIDWVQLWFLTSLFVTLVFANMLLHAVQHVRRRTAVLTAVTLALFVLGAATVDLFSNIAARDSAVLTMMFGPDAHIRGLPFNLDLLPLTSAFLLAGYLLRERIKQPVFRLWPLLAAVALFIALNLAWFYVTDLNLRIYGHWLVTPARAMCGIYIVLSLSTLIDRQRLLATPLAYLGRASLFILIFHGYIEWNLAGKLFGRFGLSDYPLAVAGLLLGVLVPLALYEVTRRVAPLGWLLLPYSRRTRPVAGAIKVEPAN